MSKIYADAGYNNELWLDQELSLRAFTFTWNQHTINFHIHGISVSTKIVLTEAEQFELVKCLARKDPSQPPHWQTLSVSLHRLVEQITNQIFEGAQEADSSIRKLRKGLRLPPLKFRNRITSAGQTFPVIRWHFSEDEYQKFLPLFKDLGTAAEKGYKNGIDIPMPVHFERRNVHLNEDEVNKVNEYLKAEKSSEPFRNLYSIALDNFVNRSYDSAILILATSIETALKWWLFKCGDPISEYLISNIQSPPIDRLYSCTRKNTPINLPKHFGAWLVRLRDSRNKIAHKPENHNFHPLEIARWFALGEAIIGALDGNDIEPMTGFIVEPVGEKADKNFPPDSKGVILRREILHKVNSFHIVLDTGETWRFSEETFKKSENQSF